MALKNIQEYLPPIKAHNSGVVKLNEIEFTASASDPTTNLSAGRMYYKTGTGVRVYSGSSWSTLGAGSGGHASWDSLYDLDTSLTVDGASMTFAGTHATNDVVTITNASGTGDCLQITNSGSGDDIEGTSGTWKISAAGAITATGLTMADSETITLGTGSDAIINWTGSVLDIEGATNFDGNVTIESAHNLTMAAGTLTLTNTTFTYTKGDMAMSDGSLAITDADNAGSFSVTNATVTDGGNLVTITGDAVTTEALLYIDNGGASLTGAGAYIDCNDDGTSDFKVGPDGATTITTTVASTKALAVTGVQTSENMVTFDNTGGVIASGNAVLLLDAGGAVADGGNILRVAFTGAPAATAIAEEIVMKADTRGLFINGAGLDTHEALYIDADSTDCDIVGIHSDAIIDDDKAVLAIDTAGAVASGGNLLRLTTAGTPNSGAIVFEIVSPDNCAAVAIDSDSSTNDAVKISGSGALAAGKAMLCVTNDAAITDGSYYVDITSGANGAASTDSYLLHVDATHTNIEAIHVESGDVKFDENLTVTGTLTQTGAATFTAGQQSASVSRTAGDGTGTALIADGTTFVTVTPAANANSWVTLPTPTPGNIVWLYIATTGCEIRSNEPQTVAINGGTHTAAESELAAGELARLVCTSATTWVGTIFAADGTESKMDAAAA